MDAGGVGVTGDSAFRDPRWEWPEYPADAVVELRVHGVGGEGPEGMTRDEHPVLVGGDEDVGFWRARNPHDRGAGTADAGRSARVREVVSWGGSTSGRSRSALWVVLLPFALFNAAGRMAPGDAGETHHELHQAVCRILALSLTLSVVATASGIAFDLLGLQCAASTACTTAPLVGRWLLAPLRWSGADAAGLLATLAIVPLAVPFLLRFAGRRQLARKPPLADPGPDHHRDRGARRLDEADAWHNLWPAWRLRGIHVTAGYGWVLLVLGLLVPSALPDAAGLLRAAAPLGVSSLLASTVLAGLPRVAGSAPSTGYRAAILAVRWATLVPLGLVLGVAWAQLADVRSSSLAPLVGLAAVAAFLWSSREHLRHMTGAVEGGSGPSGTVRDVVLASSTAAVGMLLSLDGTDRLTSAELPDALAEVGRVAEPFVGGLAGAVYLPVWILVGIQTVLLMGLTATSRGRGSDRRDRGPLPLTRVPGNLTAPVLALVTMLLTAAIGAGLHSFVLDWLGTRVVDGDEAVVLVEEAADELAERAAEATAQGSATTELDVAATVEPREAVGLVLPWWYVLTAVVVVATLVVLAAAVLAVQRWLRRRTRPSVDDVRAALGRSIAGLPDDEQLGSPRRAAVAEVIERTTGQWLHQGLVQRAGAVLGTVVAVVLVVLAVFVVVVGIDDLATTQLPGDTVALALLAALPFAAVLLLRAARTDRVVRRQVGALWDVLCFWPRVTHPFSPPSYGEAVVPAVVERLNRYPTDSTVVLAGHSQGSVIALAAVVSPALHRRRIHLVTYGSPVSLLYEGFFPSVFGGDDGAIALATPTGAADDRSPLATWHNVLSLTEPISTPVWSWSAAGPATPQDDCGWPVRLRLPWARCPACGWVRPDLDDTQGVLVTRRATDVTITDPDRVLSPSFEVDGRAAGHSSYHRSRELDLHIAHLD